MVESYSTKVKVVGSIPTIRSKPGLVAQMLESLGLYPKGRGIRKPPSPQITFQVDTGQTWRYLGDPGSPGAE